MPTLEQQRAQNTWTCAERYTKEHVNLAKGLPTLIMNSGLMQVMAFLHAKSTGKDGRPKTDDHHYVLAQHLRTWLHGRFNDIPESFEGFMQKLMQADSHKYQAITTEAFAWLKWLRQMAAARRGGT